MELDTFGQDQLLSELIHTDAFQRLGTVRFLGGIDYLFVRSPNGLPGNVRYTRLQHSLGVARLALVYSARFDLSPTDRHLITAAALLHDIGHAPLSHSIEPVFRELFALDHHDATRAIVFGHVQIGRPIYKILRGYSVDIDQLSALIAGKNADFHAFFSGPINFDTIEGILRTRAFGNAPPASTPDAIVDAAINRTSTADRDTVDQFWSYKDQVYKSIVNSSRGILADQVCQAFARRHSKNLDASDYFTNEATLFGKLPGLRQLLTSPDFVVEAKRHLPKVVSYTARRFLIDRSTDFFARNDRARYFHRREPMTLNLGELTGDDHEV